MRDQSCRQKGVLAGCNGRLSCPAAPSTYLRFTFPAYLLPQAPHLTLPSSAWTLSCGGRQAGRAWAPNLSLALSAPRASPRCWAAWAAAVQTLAAMLGLLQWTGSPSSIFGEVGAGLPAV